MSECVGSDFKGPCKDTAFPVPCGDGTCRSDYVSCLRAMSERVRTEETRDTLLWAMRERSRAAREQAQERGEVDDAAGHAAASRVLGRASALEAAARDAAGLLFAGAMPPSGFGGDKAGAQADGDSSSDGGAEPGAAAAGDGRAGAANDVPGFLSTGSLSYNDRGASAKPPALLADAVASGAGTAGLRSRRGAVGR